LSFLSAVFQVDWSSLNFLLPLAPEELLQSNGKGFYKPLAFPVMQATDPNGSMSTKMN